MNDKEKQQIANFKKLKSADDLFQSTNRCSLNHDSDRDGCRDSSHIECCYHRIQTEREFSVAIRT